MVQKFAYVMALSLAVVSSVDAFLGVLPSTHRHPIVAPCEESALILRAARRELLESSAALILGSMALAAPASAEGGFDDLSMPSAEEQKKSDEEAMKERLRRKAELQKAKSQPATFKDSMKREQEKQGALKKSGEERRNALCEELGRGC